ncbi:hypothetical protein [Rossellomorea aquimaris]|uniref:hypothetical protein n=1 Tax=Rossellomorea aquimaris TaxID=189382 RepID=UPI0007D05716|nr:hypothetical protein [Rossellomorea aquimaris]
MVHIQKEQFIQGITNSIESLVRYYENEIAELKNENQRLQTSLRKEKDRKKYYLKAESIKETMQLLLQTGDDHFLEGFRKIATMEASSMDSYIRLVRYLLKLNLVEYASYYSENLNHTIVSNPENTYKEVKKLCNMLVNDSMDYIHEMEDAFKTILTILGTLTDSSIRKNLQNYLKDNYLQLNEKFIDLNVPFLMFELLSIYHNLHLNRNSDHLLSRVEDEWEYIENNLNFKDLVLLLIYSKDKSESLFDVVLYKMAKDYPNEWALVKNQRIECEVELTSASSNTYKDKQDRFANLSVESKLKSYGYQITNRTNTQRWSSLYQALKKEMSKEEIQQFIEYRLWLAQSTHAKGKRDYSNAISCYEIDLEKLNNYKE